MPSARKLALPLALAALFGPAAPAAAQNQIFNDFQSDGAIDPCAYSRDQLQDGLNNLPPDLQQYAPGFGEQLRAGLETQCGGPVPTTETDTTLPGVVATGGGGPGPVAQIPKPPAPKPSARQRLGNVAPPPVSVAPIGSDAPGWLTPLFAGLAALMLLAGLAGMRAAGLSGERFTGPLRASFADLGGRSADALATAADIFRFGR